MLCQLYVIVHFQGKFTSNSDRDSTYIETEQVAIDLVEPGRSVEKHIEMENVNPEFTVDVSNYIYCT